MKVKLLKQNKVGWTIGGVLHEIESIFEIEDNVYQSAIQAGIKLEVIEKVQSKRKDLQNVSSKSDNASA